MKHKRHKSGKRHGLYGSRQTAGHKRNISRAIKGMFAGSKHPFWGKHRSKETRLRIGRSNKKTAMKKRLGRAKK